MKYFFYCLTVLEVACMLTVLINTQWVNLGRKTKNDDKLQRMKQNIKNDDAETKEIKFKQRPEGIRALRSERDERKHPS